jgi:hypothetical protein
MELILTYVPRAHSRVHQSSAPDSGVPFDNVEILPVPLVLIVSLVQPLLMLML